MTDLNDKKTRQELISRYLNAETTIEEEQHLQNFFKHNKEELTPEEEDFRLVIISTTHLAGDVGVADEKVAEFDKMMGGENVGEKTNKITSMILWPSSMVAALMLAIFLLTKEAINDTPSSKQYAKMTTTTTTSYQQPPLEDTPQQKGKEAEFQNNIDKDRVAQELKTLACGKEKREEDIPKTGENKSEVEEAEEVETSETEIPDATPKTITTKSTIDEPNYKQSPLNVTAANYNEGHKDNNHFLPSRNFTIFANDKPNTNASHYTIINTVSGMKMFYTEMQDDSAIYIIDGIRVTKETAKRISSDRIKEIRRLKRGTLDAINEDLDGLHYDIILITTKWSDTNEQDNSLAPQRNTLLVSDDDTRNGTCLL